MTCRLLLRIQLCLITSVLIVPILPMMTTSIYAQAPTDEELKALEQQIEKKEAETEAKRKAEAERKQKEEEAAQQRAAEEQKKQEEAAAKQAAEAEKKKQEEEEKQKTATEAQKKQEEEEKQKAAAAELTRPGREFQDALKDGSKGPAMVVIPAGSFTMGSPSSEPGHSDDEGPQHQVTIAKPFAMGKYEVTFEDYDRYCRATGKECPGDEGWGRGNRPVINVSWDDAVAFAAWLSEQTGQRYRLPSEAEWEYAARAGTTTAYWWGSEASKDRAKYGTLFGGPVPVGTFPANAFGLHDTVGNVLEWVQDCWNGSYAGAPSDGSAWISGNCSRRVYRGGSWFYYPEEMRSASRYGTSPDGRDGGHVGRGFRLLQDLD